MKALDTSEHCGPPTAAPGRPRRHNNHNNHDNRCEKQHRSRGGGLRWATSRVLCTLYVPGRGKIKTKRDKRERERVRTYYAWSGRYTDTITRLEYRLHTASSIISRRCRRSHEKKKLWKRIGWVRECTGIRVQRENNERNRKSKAKPTIKAQAGNQVFLHTALLLSLTSSVL